MAYQNNNNWSRRAEAPGQNFGAFNPPGMDRGNHPDYPYPQGDQPAPGQTYGPQGPYMSSHPGWDMARGGGFSGYGGNRNGGNNIFPGQSTQQPPWPPRC